MTNFYTLLKVQQNADEKAIRDAVKKERRVWNQRTAHPKAEIRTDAENKLREIAEAERILLNNNSRAQYDRELSSYREPTQPIGDTGGDRDWLAVSIQYIERGEYNSASYTIQNAVNQQPNNPVVWYRKFQVSSNLGNTRDADFEIHEAIRLDPENSEYYSELGEFYFGQDMCGRAIEQFSTAISKGNDADWNNSRIAICIVDDKNYDASQRALQSIEMLYNRHKDSEYYQYMYALILLITARSACSNQLMFGTETEEICSRDNNGNVRVVGLIDLKTGIKLYNSTIDTLNKLPNYFITNENQCNTVKNLYAKAINISSNDSDVKNTISEIGEMITLAEKQKIGALSIQCNIWGGLLSIMTILGLLGMGVGYLLTGFAGIGLIILGCTKARTLMYKWLGSSASGNIPKELRQTGLQK